MSSYAVAPVHERRHRAGESAEWTELWHYEFGQDEAGLGGFVRFALQPRQRRTQFWAGVVRVGGPYVLCRDAELELPPTPNVLEIRGGGLWTHAICETPFEHWTIAMEAYALVFEDPFDALADERGDRIGLAFDLEWEQRGAVAPLVLDGADGYELPCVVHGVLQIGDDRWEIAATGHRAHSWGAFPVPLPTGAAAPSGAGIAMGEGCVGPFLVERPSGPAAVLRTWHPGVGWTEVLP